MRQRHVERRRGIFMSCVRRSFRPAIDNTMIAFGIPARMSWAWRKHFRRLRQCPHFQHGKLHGTMARSARSNSTTRFRLTAGTIGDDIISIRGEQRKLVQNHVGVVEAHRFHAGHHFTNRLG